MKRTLLACLLLVALLATVSGTVAYFTDSVQTRGSIASGNLDIAQHEYERVKQSDGTYILQPYTQKQVIYPAVGELTTHDCAVKVSADSDKTIALNGTMKNLVDKIVVAENKGSLNAYVRTFVAVPAHYYLENGEEVSVSWLHLDTNTNDGWKWAATPVKNVNIDGDHYDIYYATNTEVLAPGATTAPSLLGFYLDRNVSQKNGEYIYKTGGGDYVSLGSEASMTILVATEATQANVFDAEGEKTAAQVAMEATYFEEPSNTRHPWANVQVATTQEKLDTLLENASSNYNAYIGLKDQNYTLPEQLPNGVHLFAMSANVKAKTENGTIGGYDIELSGITFTDEVTLTGHGSFTDILFEKGFKAAPTTGDMVIDHCVFDQYTVTPGEYQVAVSNCRKTTGEIIE